MENSNIYVPSPESIKPSISFHWIFKSVGIFLIIFVVMCSVVAYKVHSGGSTYIKYYQDNWDKYRCQPYILPFSGIIKKEDGKTIIQSTNSNFAECFGQYFKIHFDSFLSPIYDFFNKIVDVIEDLILSVQNIRQMFNYIRDTTEEQLYDVADMLYNYGKKMSEGINRVMEIFTMLLHSAEGSLYGVSYTATTFGFLMNGPVKMIENMVHDITILLEALAFFLIL